MNPTPPPFFFFSLPLPKLPPYPNPIIFSHDHVKPTFVVFCFELPTELDITFSFRRRRKKNPTVKKLLLSTPPTHWFYLFFSLPPSFVFSFLFSFSVYMLNETYNLRNKSRGSGTLVSPVGRQLAGATVVSCKTMDFRFNENKTKLRVSVLAVSFEMFTNGDSLFNKTV